MSRAVVVTTSHRDVWYGQTEEDGRSPTIQLTDARHCFYWGRCDGISGLAANGPGSGAKIGATVARTIVRDVVTVMDCSENAVGRFSDAGWAT